MDWPSAYIPEPNSGCWIWLKAIGTHGYGVTQNPKTGNPTTAHRVSFEAHKGPIPPGMCVLHRCDCRPCINPDHLFLGTDADNVADKIKKGRLRWGISVGESHGESKLTDTQVLEIRKSPDSGRALAKRYNVSQATIWYIKKRRTWRHLDG